MSLRDYRQIAGVVTPVLSFLRATNRTIRRAVIVAFRHSGIPVVCAILAGAPAVLAQDPDLTYQYEFSGFGGGSFVPDLHLLTQVSGSSTETSRTVGMSFASAYQLGVRINENLGAYWSADLEYSFANQPVRFTNLSPTIPDLTLGQSVHHLTYNVSYLALSGTNRFRPQAKIGVGTALFFIHQSSKEQAEQLGLPLQDTWRFVFNWGGGFKYLIAENQGALLFDFKDQISSIPSYGLPSTAQVLNGVYQPGFSRSKFMNNLQFNFGISYRWNDW